MLALRKSKSIGAATRKARRKSRISRPMGLETAFTSGWLPATIASTSARSGAFGTALGILWLKSA